jgi:uncharacterized protein (DUF1778 family)
MATTTITLKVPVERKRLLQTEARQAKQSLNAYLLNHLISSGQASLTKRRPDYAKITACMAEEHAALCLVDHLDR